MRLDTKTHTQKENPNRAQNVRAERIAEPRREGLACLRVFPNEVFYGKMGSPRGQPRCSAVERAQKEVPSPTAGGLFTFDFLTQVPRF